MMQGRYFVCSIVFLGGMLLAGMSVAPADEQDFLDYSNDRSSFPKHHAWSLFLGTGWTRDDLRHVEELVKDQKLLNPFTNQPFEKLQVFAFGQKNPVGELTRIITDHLEVHILSSQDELKGYRFDFGICHSNGCTVAIDAHRQGILRVDHFLALGTDWTSKDFQPGTLKDSELLFFATQGDPIWKIPAPNWARVTESTPGLKFSIPFDRPQEVVSGMGHLLTQGRAAVDTFPVIHLQTPSGQKGALLKPFRPHALFDSYFPALRQWMSSGGPLQRSITEKIRQREAAFSQDDKKKFLLRS